jgi:hypothetical protein
VRGPAIICLDYLRRMLSNTMASDVIMLSAFADQAIPLEGLSSFLGVGVAERTPA